MLYINLDIKPERRISIENTINQINITSNVIRIPGELTPQCGYLGAVRSHIKAIETAKNNNYTNVIIFEDDFIWGIGIDQVKRNLSEFFDKLGSSYDICLLTSFWTKNLVK